MLECSLGGMATEAFLNPDFSVTPLLSSPCFLSKADTSNWPCYLFLQAGLQVVSVGTWF